MELSFSEAAKGASKELSVNMEDTCPRCDGRGNEPGTKVSHCHYCNGTGMVSVPQPRPPTPQGLTGCVSKSLVCILQQPSGLPAPPTNARPLILYRYLDSDICLPELTLIHFCS